MLRRRFSLTGNSEVVLLTSRFYETSNPCFDGKVPWTVALDTCYFVVHTSSYTFLSYNPCPILATWALSENTYWPPKKNHGIQKIPWFFPLFFNRRKVNILDHLCGIPYEPWSILTIWLMVIPSIIRIQKFHGYEINPIKSPLDD